MKGAKMNKHDATEAAYKNGYAQGRADAEQMHDDFCAICIERERTRIVREMLNRISEHATKGFPKKVRLDVIERIAKELAGEVCADRSST